MEISKEMRPKSKDQGANLLSGEANDVTLRFARRTERFHDAQPVGCSLVRPPLLLVLHASLCSLLFRSSIVYQSPRLEEVENPAHRPDVSDERPAHLREGDLPRRVLSEPSDDEVPVVHVQARVLRGWLPVKELRQDPALGRVDFPEREPPWYQKKGKNERESIPQSGVSQKSSTILKNIVLFRTRMAGDGDGGVDGGRGGLLGGRSERGGALLLRVVRRRSLIFHCGQRHTMGRMSSGRRLASRRWRSRSGRRRRRRRRWRRCHENPSKLSEKPEEVIKPLRSLNDWNTLVLFCVAFLQIKPYKYH